MLFLNDEGDASTYDDLKVNDSEDGAETNDVEMTEMIKRSHSRPPPDLLSRLFSNYQQNDQLDPCQIISKLLASRATVNHPFDVQMSR